VSRPIEDIVAEVESLVAKGVKEFQIIAQELTYYGTDLYKRQAIAELVERIADVKGVKWIRLHYAYPSNFPMDLLRVMREKKNVCKYLDIALQHVSTSVLTNMRRHVDKDATYELIICYARRSQEYIYVPLLW
jgi:ribosomal protein S12 methylthiotransferase